MGQISCSLGHLLVGSDFLVLEEQVLTYPLNSMDDHRLGAFNIIRRSRVHHLYEANESARSRLLEAIPQTFFSPIAHPLPQLSRQG